MNTSQIAKNKGQNLSVTAKDQKSAVNTGFSSTGAGRGRTRNTKYNALTKLTSCSGGVCSLNWKPYNPVA